MYIFQYQRLQQRLTLPQPLKPLQLLKVPQFLHSPFPQPTPQKQTPPPISYAFCPLPRESFLLQEFSNRSPAPDHRTESHSHTAEHNNCHIYIEKPPVDSTQRTHVQTFRNKKLSFIFTRQDYGHMFSKSSRIFP